MSEPYPLAADVADVQSATAAGMAAFDDRMSVAYDPMGGAELREAAPTQQPYVPPEFVEPDAAGVDAELNAEGVT